MAHFLDLDPLFPSFCAIVVYEWLVLKVLRVGQSVAVFVSPFPELKGETSRQHGVRGKRGLREHHVRRVANDRRMGGLISKVAATLLGLHVRSLAA